MELNGNGSCKHEIQEEMETDSITSTVIGKKLGDFIPIYIPAVEKRVLNQNPHERRFLDFLKARPSRDWFLKSNFFRKNASIEGAQTQTSTDLRRFRVPFVRRINWKALINSFKNWIKNPAHIAFLIWLAFVAGGLILLALVMLGLLNEEIPSSSRRKKWIEIINQILNALFMILCLYQHPKISHHLVLALRWNLEDRVELRKVYCKDGALRSHERAHMLFVIMLLHITCVSQYVLCGLYWGISMKVRPDWAVNVCIGVGIAAPIIAGVYSIKSPLGKRYETESDEESRRQVALTNSVPNEDQLNKYNRRVVVTSPEWIGGLFDCCDDKPVACLSLFCVCCVFGWNMERLGFGNMYVHIFTFILFCIGPFLVFSASALNINDDTIRYVVGIFGITLCFFGMLYGGFWRIQMRKRYKLPGKLFCFGYPSVTDCFQWFFCWSCSLAQEVRTGNFYDIEDSSFYRSVAKDEDQRQIMVPLNREGGSTPVFVINAMVDYSTRSKSFPPSRSTEMVVQNKVPVLLERVSTFGPVHSMRPPLPPLIQLED
ncbi:PLAC8 motif-containing protein [Dioscorea alata]|uniref:PLAC8 motif-containing protein n=1 Tax=Dioscorea alata TaxID=55571 RepID=A0ACB7V2E1_DIOAL|nr:PLAC8 motif-containing protein [Dioscorea alata]